MKLSHLDYVNHPNQDRFRMATDADLFSLINQSVIYVCPRAMHREECVML